MDATPRLIETAVPRAPEGLVLVLHGGSGRRGSPTQLSVLRMVPIARRVARAGRGRLAVFRLLNSVRGWDGRHTPVDDVHWALRLLADRFPGLPPTGLVGHSLGGRAALVAGDAPGVRSVAALNPWVYPSDATPLPGRDVLVVHGSADRIAGPDDSATVARLLSRTAHVSYVRVEGGRHAMLRPAPGVRHPRRGLHRRRAPAGRHGVPGRAGAGVAPGLSGRHRGARPLSGTGRRS